MAADFEHQHKAGALKQQNKTHKHGKHKSKRTLDKDTKGRVNVKVLTRRNKQSMNKYERRHTALQRRKEKRNEIIERKRNRGGSNTPPHFVAIVSLHQSASPKAALELLKRCDADAVIRRNSQCLTHISIPRFKQRASFFIPEDGNQMDLLDAAKVADSVLCLLSPKEGMDEAGELSLRCLFGHGAPAATFVCQGFKNLPLKRQGDSRKLILKQLEQWFSNDKFHSLDNTQDALLVMRQITNQKLRSVRYREHRPHLIGENLSFELDDENLECGTLKVTGYLRGQALSVNRLVHLPGWGDFQMTQIDSAPDPNSLHTKNETIKRKNSISEEGHMECTGGETEVQVLDKVNPSQQDSLDTEVIPDPMSGEQTWPTQEELDEAEEEAGIKRSKVVPKGTSEYQASWIVESDDEANDDEDDDESSDEEMQLAEVEEEESEDDAEDATQDYETMTVTEGGDTANYDETMDLDEEKRMLEKIKEENQHRLFPDEVDTPIDMLAKDRFARYRGLKSYRTSTWDPKENLPSDYARIFQFENFQKTRKRCLTEEPENGALPGWYITVHVAKVPKSFMDNRKPTTPLVLFGLLPHEQKMSVLHFVIRKQKDVEEPIKSKERLIFHVGFRRFSACPIFSQHTLGRKHKLERFLPDDTATVATVYAPVFFPPAPVLIFKESDGAQELVATGFLHSVNPDRIITKRIVLSGHPFKILKRSAVIRYMFFNKDDVAWFKPVELRTKWGRRGHIRDSLGTHGHMKCVFDGALKSQDTVLMNLYKRLYPKWTYNSFVPNLPFIKPSQSDMEDTEEPERGQAYEIFNT